MIVIIRTDASITIGSGHVMRCLTIAEQFRKKGHVVYFWMEDLPGNLMGYVRYLGYEIIESAKDADLYIIDHYDIAIEWEHKIRQHTKKIVVIDDLANRFHDCDLLIDQNFVPNYQYRYDDLVPDNCIKLLGPSNLILREEFVQERKKLRSRDGSVKRLLVFMGGSDPTAETLKILTALKGYLNFPRIDVVVGKSNPLKDQIEMICSDRGYQFHCQINYMARLITAADFSIGAGGSTTWERCFLGLPSSSTIVAENQQVATETAAGIGAVLNLGWHENVTSETYRELLNTLAFEKEKLIKISEVGLALTEQPRKESTWLEKILEVAK